MIRTKRLWLREMTASDTDALYQVFGDKENMKYYPSPFTYEMAKGWIDRNLLRYRIFGFGLWAVCLKETGEVIGDCGLTMQNINGVIKPEIGYHIRRDLQQKGYAKEASVAVRDWVFENTPFQMVYSYMQKDNLPSAKTAMAYGCRFIEIFTDENHEQTAVYALSKPDWERMKKHQKP